MALLWQGDEDVTSFKVREWLAAAAVDRERMFVRGTSAEGYVLTSLTNNDEGSGEMSDTEQQLGYGLPRQMTSAGVEAFKKEVRNFAARLVQQMQVAADLDQRTDPQYTADNVRTAAGIASERRMHEDEPAAETSGGILAAILLTISTVGVSTMANFLHSNLQVAVFVLLIVVGVVGLVLTWSTRPRKRGPNDG